MVPLFVMVCYYNLLWTSRASPTVVSGGDVSPVLCACGHLIVQYTVFVVRFPTVCRRCPSARRWWLVFGSFACLVRFGSVRAATRLLQLIGAIGGGCRFRKFPSSVRCGQLWRMRRRSSVFVLSQAGRMKSSQFASFLVHSSGKLFIVEIDEGK